MSSQASIFTPRFFVMCGFTFTAFLSALQLFPTVPFRVLDLGGTALSAGLFLGVLTYASACSAPFTGALGDRFGRRRLIMTASLLTLGLACAYAASPNWHVLLVIGLAHGVVWSALLSSCSAYMAGVIPESRRAEGIGYWGLASVFAVAIAPSVGLWAYRHGWIWLCFSVGVLNLFMAFIAWFLPDEPAASAPKHRPVLADLVEWRVALAGLTLFLYSFGYGGVMSFVALYSVERGVAPRGLFFAIYAAAIIVTRPFAGRLADRIGHTKVFVPCLILIAAGYALLSYASSPGWFIAAALVFGCGFGSAYPAFIAHVLTHVSTARRGAAFGGLIAAFDTGIGTGSIALGWVGQRFGFSRAYAVAAVVAALALPYFVIVEPRVLSGVTGRPETG
jgi:MFS family permease